MDTDLIFAGDRVMGHFKCKIRGPGPVIMLSIMFFAFSSPAHSAQCGDADAAIQSGPAATVSEIQIADIAWTTGIVNHCPTVRIFNEIKLPQRLFLWMRLEGGESAFKQLQAEGRLPLKHRWSYNIGSKIIDDKGDEIEQNEFATTDNVNVTRKISINTESLASEIKLRGVFDWRTWSYKQQLARHFYKVEILDQKNNPVPCSDALRCDECQYGIRCAVIVMIK